MKGAEKRAEETAAEYSRDERQMLRFMIEKTLREADVRADERAKVDPTGILAEMIVVTKDRRFCDDGMGDEIEAWTERIGNGVDVALEAIEDRDLLDEDAYRIYRRCLIETGARVVAAIQSFDKRKAEGTLVRTDTEESEA